MLNIFLTMQKKQNLSATRELGTGEKIAVIIAKTVVHDIATTAELGAGKRSVAHVLGMWGTILFWIASVVMIFCYTSSDTSYTYYMANDVAHRSNNDLCRWLLVLVIFKS